MNGYTLHAGLAQLPHVHRVRRGNGAAVVEELDADDPQPLALGSPWGQDGGRHECHGDLDGDAGSHDD